MGVLLIIPGLAVFIAVILYPFIDAILMSFTNKSMIDPNTRFVGLENYIKVFYRSLFSQDHVHHFFVCGTGHGGAPFVLGFIWAILLNQGFRGSEPLRGITLVNGLPPALPSAFVELDLQWPVRRVERCAQGAGRCGQHGLARPDGHGTALRGRCPHLANAALVHGLLLGGLQGCQWIAGGGAH